MSDPSALRTYLATQLEATVARRSHAEILHGVPPAARGLQPEGLPEVYSLWQLLEHMRLCQTDYFRFCTDPDYSSPTWPDDYWPDSVTPPSEEAWANSLDRFQRELRSLKDFVSDSSVDLTEEIPHANEIQERDRAASYHGSTYAEEIACIADHNAYHLGQFVTVRRLLDVWPPEIVEPPTWDA